MHNKYDVLESSPNHPPLLVYGNIVFHETGTKKVGDCCSKDCYFLENQKHWQTWGSQQRRISLQLYIAGERNLKERNRMIPGSVSWNTWIYWSNKIISGKYDFLKCHCGFLKAKKEVNSLTSILLGSINSYVEHYNKEVFKCLSVFESCYTYQNEPGCRAVKGPAASVKNQPARQEIAYNARYPGLIPGLGRCLWEGNGNLLQYSCLGNSMDRGALAGYCPLGYKESDTTYHHRV